MAVVPEKYKNSEVIGEGSFGVVYKAQRVSDGATIALKVVRIPTLEQCHGDTDTRDKIIKDIEKEV